MGLMSELDQRSASLLGSIKQKNKALYIILQRCQFLWDDEKLCIYFPNRFFEKKFTIANRGGVLEAALAELGHSSIVIELDLRTVNSDDSLQQDEVNQEGAEAEELIESDDRIYLMWANIENFRSISKTEISFHKKVNVIVGANNSGKSTIIDAIRIALQVGKYKKSKYISIDDFRDVDKEIKIDLKFYCPASVTGLPELKTFEKDESGKRCAYLNLHVVYYITKGGQVKQRFWGGNSGGRVPDDDALDIFSFDYLGALRDATSALRPSTTSKIADLLLNLRTAKVDRQKIETVYGDAQKDAEVVRLVGEASTSVDAHLGEIALKHDRFGVQLQPLPPVFEEIVGSFEMKLLMSKIQSPVSQNGLGYNNILYASTVLGHVQTTKKHDNDRYHALLIEEPEAHLHPQLEDSFFSYLASLSNDVGSQVIVTSHSAIISSATHIDNLIVLHKSEEATEAINVSSIDLEPTEKRKITRYLDVTKSRLFFAKSVIFVEGMTEALLMAKLADAHLGEKDSLLNHGIEIVDIDGVSFEPYAKLFNNKNYSLPMKAAIITDKDSYTDDESKYHDISERTENTKSFEGHNLKVFTTDKKTLEIDLWNAGNEDVMKESAGKLFTRSDIKSPDDILRLIKNSSKWGKGDFAHELLESAKDIKPPKHVTDALDWVTKDATN